MQLVFSLVRRYELARHDERFAYILRVRNMARACAESYHARREALGFPLCEEAAP